MGLAKRLMYTGGAVFLSGIISSSICLRNMNYEPILNEENELIHEIRKVQYNLENSFFLDNQDKRNLEKEENELINNIERLRSNQKYAQTLDKYKVGFFGGFGAIILGGSLLGIGGYLNRSPRKNN